MVVSLKSLFRFNSIYFCELFWPAHLLRYPNNILPLNLHKDDLVDKNYPNCKAICQRSLALVVSLSMLVYDVSLLGTTLSAGNFYYSSKKRNHYFNAAAYNVRKL
jgi:hypothetical protein